MTSEVVKVVAEVGAATVPLLAPCTNEICHVDIAGWLLHDVIDEGSRTGASEQIL